jgi:hypothetical protein
MILTAPAMMSGNPSPDVASSFLRHKEGPTSFFTTTVIKRFVDHPTVIAMRAVPRASDVAPFSAVTSVVASAVTSASSSAAVGATTSAVSAVIPAAATISAAASPAATAIPATAVRSVSAAIPAVATLAAATPAATPVAVVTVKKDNSPMERSADAKTAELRMVVHQASLIYAAMDLQDCGLDPKAFEYAWRGYHNLLKGGVIHKRTVLSICDFSQSSRNKRMYVIDVQHRKLLYRTYVAHGQNSGDEFASDFSNEPDSYKSSLGFYVTQKTYIGRNGLSLRLDGVDPGYNDMAVKRQIVLHGSTYVGEKYMQDYGNLGTSLGCPALPVEVSGRIIRTVKDGSCLFIYHPTQQYLDNSSVLHG